MIILKPCRDTLIKVYKGILRHLKVKRWQKLIKQNIRQNYITLVQTSQDKKKKIMINKYIHESQQNVSIFETSKTARQRKTQFRRIIFFFCLKGKKFWKSLDVKEKKLTTKSEGP